MFTKRISWLLCTLLASAGLSGCVADMEKQHNTPTPTKYGTHYKNYIGEKVESEDTASDSTFDEEESVEDEEDGLLS